MTTLNISGMTCQNCVKHVKEALAAVPGASDVQVDLAAGRATVAGDAEARALVAAVEEEGYEVTVA